MGDKSKINWCDASLAVVTGCTPAGAGCQNCYAKRMFRRLSSMPNGGKYIGRDFGDVRFHIAEFAAPMAWKRGRSVFVSPMGDLFHASVDSIHVRAAFLAMADMERHTWIVLTKRAERMWDLITRWTDIGDYAPARNIVLGVSCSTQDEVDRMVPALLRTPANRRIVSIEPLVEGVDIRRYLTCRGCGTRMLHNLPDGALACCPEYTNSLSGVIVGGESGPNARPMHPDWVRSLRDQCKAAGVPFFFKQWGDYARIIARNYTDYSCSGANHKEPHAGRTLDGRTHDDLCWEVRT